MKIPSTIFVFGHAIDVRKVSVPEEIPGIGTILGRYVPSKQEITLFDNPDKPSVAESNFIHEAIEAIDVLGDLKLNHTQISTLSSALHQVFTDVLAEDYAEAA